MSWCGCVCDTIEDAADWVEDQAGDAIDAVTDAVSDAAEAVAGAVSDAADWVADAATDAAEAAAAAAGEAWDWASATADEVCAWIADTAGDVWDWAGEAASDALDWVSETASDAWDWMNDAASTVMDALASTWDAVSGFVMEEVLPFLADALWILTHVDDIIFAGLSGLWCLITGQDEREYDFIEGLYLLDPTVLASRKVAFLPQDRGYVVFSDHHMFVAGDELDRFRQIGNNALYVAVLGTYAGKDYTLVENGDVEDLWMKERTISGSLFDVVTDALGWPFGDMLADEYEHTRIRSQALGIFANNIDVYGMIRECFQDQGRYVRLLGNHDDAWGDADYLPGLQSMYPGLEVYDYGLVGDYGSGEPAYGNSPKAIVAHGHQFDAWNNSACRSAGAAVTETVSGIPALAAGVTTKADWEAALAGLGFQNELGDSAFTIDEVEFNETYEKDFRQYPIPPQFVLGHTHSPLKDPQIPGWMYKDRWNFKEYTNEGTAGRWEQFIWCAEIIGGAVRLYGWTWGPEGKPSKREFVGGFADYLQPV